MWLLVGTDPLSGSCDEMGRVRGGGVEMAQKPELLGGPLGLVWQGLGMLPRSPQGQPQGFQTPSIIHDLFKIGKSSPSDWGVCPNVFHNY